MQALRNLSKSSTTFRRSAPAPARDPPAEEHVVGQHEAMGGEEATLEALIQSIGCIASSSRPWISNRTNR